MKRFLTLILASLLLVSCEATTTTGQSHEQLQSVSHLATDVSTVLGETTTETLTQDPQPILTPGSIRVDEWVMEMIIYYSPKYEGDQVVALRVEGDGTVSDEEIYSRFIKPQNLPDVLKEPGRIYISIPDIPTLQPADGLQIKLSYDWNAPDLPKPVEEEYHLLRRLFSTDLPVIRSMHPDAPDYMPLPRQMGEIYTDIAYRAARYCGDSGSEAYLPVVITDQKGASREQIYEDFVKGLGYPEEYLEKGIVYFPLSSTDAYIAPAGYTLYFDMPGDSADSAVVNDKEVRLYTPSADDLKEYNDHHLGLRSYDHHSHVPAYYAGYFDEYFK